MKETKSLSKLFSRCDLWQNKSYQHAMKKQTMKARKMRKKKLDSYRSMRDNRSTAEWMRLAEASGDHLIPASAQSKVNHNRLLRSVSI